MTGYILFTVLWLIVFYVIWSEWELERLGVEKGRFSHPFLDGLHRHGHIFPLKHFADNDDELTKKGEIMKTRLKQAGLSPYFSVRSYMSFAFVVLIVSLIIGATVVYLTQYSAAGARIIFGVEMEEADGGMNISQATMTMMVFLLIAILPSMYLKQRSKKHVALSAKELPMLQMFVILMLRSNKTVPEIIFSLSKVHSGHKEIFMKGYRIYSRNPAEGMEYMRGNFSGSRFADMFDLLEDVSEYAREETVEIMESTLKALVDETNDIRRKNDISQLLYSQASMVAPYSALILLGIAPIVVMAIDLFSSSMAM